MIPYEEHFELLFNFLFCLLKFCCCFILYEIRRTIHIDFSTGYYEPASQMKSWINNAWQNVYTIFCLQLYLQSAVKLVKNQIGVFRFFSISILKSFVELLTTSTKFRKCFCCSYCCVLYLFSYFFYVNEHLRSHILFPSRFNIYYLLIIMPKCCITILIVA